MIMLSLTLGEHVHTANAQKPAHSTAATIIRSLPLRNKKR